MYVPIVYGFLPEINVFVFVFVNSISPRVAGLVLCITKRYKMIVQVYAPTTSDTVEDINVFYNDVDETLGKPNHYTIVIGDFNAQIGKRKKSK